MIAFIERRWRLVLLAASLLGVARMLVFALHDYDTHPPASFDALHIQYGGWLITQGRMMYADLWNPKPPLSMLLPVLPAWIAGDHLLALHWFYLGLMGVFAAANVLLAGQLVFDQTANAQAALFGGLALLALTWTTELGAFGYRPKVLTLAFGMLAIALANRDRPLWSGVSVALAAGFWQLGLFFGVVAAWQFVVRHRSLRGWALRYVAGGLIVALLAILPNLLDGSLDVMFEQVVTQHFSGSQWQRELIHSLNRMVERVRFYMVVLVWGLLSAAWMVVTRKFDRVWLLLGLVLFSVQVAFIDFDGTPDLLMLMALIAVCAGLLYADAGEWHAQRGRALFLFAGISVVIVAWLWRWAPASTGQWELAAALGLLSVLGLIMFGEAGRKGLIAVLAGLLVLNVLLLGEDGVFFTRPRSPLIAEYDQGPIETRDGLPSMAYMYWEQQLPPGCYMVFDVDERRYMEKHNHTVNDSCR